MTQKQLADLMQKSGMLHLRKRHNDDWVLKQLTKKRINHDQPKRH